MGMTRQERVAIHKKQEVASIKEGIPLLSELSEGVSTFRSTNEGLVEYLKFNGVLYKKLFESEFAPNDFFGTENGYLRLPNGFIMQWGQETVGDDTETVIFPIPFPNACLNVTSTAYKSGDDEGLEYAVAIRTLPTKTQVVFTTRSAWNTLFWQAIGY